MSAERGNWSWIKSDPSLILAVTTTVIYYSVMLQPGLRETWLAKYTTEHVVEYVIVMLFFWGVVDILFKLKKIPDELRSMSHQWLPETYGSMTLEAAREFFQRLQESPKNLLSTRMGSRITDVLKYVTVKGGDSELQKHLSHLAEQDDEELHQEYSLLRFVIAVTPILGFLGTVVHFGTSIGSFSFDNMESKLPVIVAGMGTAFKTTSVALAASMSVMFAMFLCERIERKNLRFINRWIERELQHRFVGTSATVGPFLEVVQSANEQSMQGLRSSLEDLSRVWNQELMNLFKFFQEQRREELTHFAAGIKLISQQHETHEVAREDLLQKMISRIDTEQDRHWQQFQASLDRATSFREDVRGLLTTLNSIAQGEGRLMELQALLADNLRVLEETSQLDSAVNGLTAAIHLLTSRSRPYGNSDSIAA